MSRHAFRTSIWSKTDPPRGVDFFFFEELLLAFADKGDVSLKVRKSQRQFFLPTIIPKTNKTIPSYCLKGGLISDYILDLVPLPKKSDLAPFDRWQCDQSQNIFCD